ncbi:MAG: 16S rRNA (uracil(1498)-N(3))-methyltransferase [Clostridiales bacterium]|nr:16S rRNA (uracil(1498)-N(3))-methyltransferase [Clostridiales bacterium]
MHQFFVMEDAVSKEEITITGSDVNHIKNVLRMRLGEAIRVSDASGVSYLCKIKEIGELFVKAEITEEVPNTEPLCRLYLFQGLPKGDKMEWIIQKAVELGVSAVIPVSMKNCIVKFDEKKAKAKQKRWQAIAESAAKQSKRSRIPSVMEVMNYSDAVKFAKEELDVCLVPYENAKGMRATREAIGALRMGQSVGILIGSEGGFAPEEIALAKECEMKIISLGKRILRTETAGIAALSMLLYQLEE